jgi:hypothetical protein
VNIAPLAEPGQRPLGQLQDEGRALGGRSVLVQPGRHAPAHPDGGLQVPVLGRSAEPLGRIVQPPNLLGK